MFMVLIREVISHTRSIDKQARPVTFVANEYYYNDLVVCIDHRHSYSEIGGSLTTYSPISSKRSLSPDTGACVLIVWALLALFSHALLLAELMCTFLKKNSLFSFTLFTVYISAQLTFQCWLCCCIRFLKKKNSFWELRLELFTLYWFCVAF
jgi:hypothetical protein